MTARDHSRCRIPRSNLAAATAQARNYVPALGGDNAAVLSSVLGYSADRIAALYEKQILHDQTGRA